MTAKDIQRHLEVYYINGVKYLVQNCYFFGNGYCETDLLVVKRDGYIYDVEIKVSRSDFFNDMKKFRKHCIIENGHFSYPHLHSSAETGERMMHEANTPIPTKDRPNRFYFAVPENLISISDVPSYAGLFFVMPDGTVKKVKEAKLLHRELIDYRDRLCDKFYHRMRNAELKNKL